MSRLWPNLLRDIDYNGVSRWSGLRCVAVATAELLTLGDAIERLEPKDSNWVAKRVTTIKRRRVNDRIGDVFEIVALGLFSTAGQVVDPAKEDQPGYDGTIRLKYEPRFYLSLKNHDVSRHEELFRKSS